jgi:hypothetical protein
MERGQDLLVKLNGTSPASLARTAVASARCP